MALPNGELSKNSWTLRLENEEPRMEARVLLSGHGAEHGVDRRKSRAAPNLLIGTGSRNFERFRILIL